MEWKAQIPRSSIPRIKVASPATLIPPGIRIFAELLAGNNLDSPLHQALESGKPSSLRVTFHSLPPAEKKILEQDWGPQLEEMFSLAQEKDPVVFFKGLLLLGMRLENGEKIGAALSVYQLFSQQNFASKWRIPEDLRRKAQARANAILGVGSFAPRFEFLADRFLQEATAPEALFGMTAAGLAFKIIRLAALSRLLPTASKASWTEALISRLFANGAGLFAESLTLPLATKSAGALLGKTQDWSQANLERESASAALVLGMMRLTGFASESAASRWLNDSGRWENFTRAVLPQGAMLNGILLGNLLEEKAGLKKPQDGATTLLDSLSTLLQFNVAGQLNHRITGPSWQAWEKNLDLHAENIAKQHAGGKGRIQKYLMELEILQISQPPWQAATVGAPTRFQNLFSQEFFSKGTGSGETGLSSEQGILEKYRSHFPPESKHTYTEAILEAALDTPSPFPEFKKRLFEAYAHLPFPYRGSREQFFLATATKELFRNNALRTATGSFQNTLLQFLLENTLAQENPDIRKTSTEKIFSAMEEGAPRKTLLGLIEVLGPRLPPIPSQIALFSELFLETHRLAAQSLQRSYRENDFTQILNFVYASAPRDKLKAAAMLEAFVQGPRSGLYDRELIDRVFDFARGHNLDALVLNRIMHLFAVGDLPGKLREIVESDPSNGMALISQLQQVGMPTDVIARTLNDTAHNAFLDHEGLSKKWVATALDFSKGSEDPQELAQSRQNMNEAIGVFLDSGKTLVVLELMNLLLVNGGKTTLALHRVWREGKVKIQLAPDKGFDEVVAQWGVAEGCKTSLLMRPKTPGKPYWVLIREMPTWDRKDPKAREQAFDQVRVRLEALVHEGEEHYPQAAGLNDEMNQKAPVLLPDDASMTRELRLVSEIMAMLGEERWYFWNVGEYQSEISQRMGEGLVSYFRGLAEQAYFAKGNRERAESLGSLPRDLPGAEAAYIPLSEPRLDAKQYLNFFPRRLLKNRRAQIIDIALSIPNVDLSFKEALLRSLSGATNAGKPEQIYTVLALKNLFAYDAIGTSTGSFDHALLQLLIRRAAKDKTLGTKIVSDILQRMEIGLTRNDLETMLTQNGYGKKFQLPRKKILSNELIDQHAKEIAREWSRYRPQDRALLLKYLEGVFQQNPHEVSKLIQIFGQARISGQYPQEAIETALDYARDHPFPILILDRMKQIFLSGDIPAKLFELRPSPPQEDGFELLENYRLRGMDFETIAQAINGTRTTGYLSDLRLARKIAATMFDVQPYLESNSWWDRLKQGAISFLRSGNVEKDPPTQRLENLSRLRREFKIWLGEEKPLDVATLFKFLELNPTPSVEALRNLWIDGKIEIQISSNVEMDALLKNWGKVEEGVDALFLEPREPGEIPQLFLRELPAFSNAKEREKSFPLFLHRLLSPLHEFGHYLHSSGEDPAIAAGEAPIKLLGINRQNRLVSEIMATLEAQPWRVRNVDIEPWILAKRLGEPLALYLRNFHDGVYFGRENREKAPK